MSTKPQSIADLTSILERMHPDRLLMVRHGPRLEEEVVAALIPALVATHDLAMRLGNIEFLLLLLHEAREVDAPRFLKTVFLPWAGLQRRTRSQRARIGEAFTNLPEAYTEDDAAHIATAIYRPLVADIFDPYLTLLTAAYAFIAGNFIDIQTSNLSASEFNKAEFICARIRESGGPVDLLDGYDAVVRNALSHTGSEGLRFEPGAIIFRTIRRGPTPKVEVRRWTHDERLPICRVEQIDLHSSYTDGTRPIFPCKFSHIRMSRHFAGMSGG
jgi:hypothetical protein